MKRLRKAVSLSMDCIKRNTREPSTPNVQTAPSRLHSPIDCSSTFETSNMLPEKPFLDTSAAHAATMMVLHILMTWISTPGFFRVSNQRRSPGGVQGAGY